MEAAEAIAAVVSSSSGFRARLEAMKALAEKDPSLARALKLDPARALDGMTYARIEISNPEEPGRFVSVRALVDTGSTDCELRGHLIEQIDLRPDSDCGFALFETAAGITTHAPVYRAIVRTCGREASCLLSPAEMDEDEDEEEEEDDDEDEVVGVTPRAGFDAAFGFEKVSDDALLGHDALAALGLAVDTSRRRLFPTPLDLGPER